MSKYYYDFHIHSCLSPCADDDMTPGNIAGMATLKGLNILALTDHNSCKNCPAFFKACKDYGIIPIAGMELSTAEDIHIVCLFEELDAAMAFDKIIESHLMPIKNKPEIFGNQLIINECDEITGCEEKLLISSTDLPIEDAIKLAREYGAQTLSYVEEKDGLSSVSVVLRMNILVLILFAPIYFISLLLIVPFPIMLVVLHFAFLKPSKRLKQVLEYILLEK